MRLLGCPNYRRLLLCTALAASAAARASDDAQSSDTHPSLEEIVVTAQKRSEKLIDVPIAISAMSGSELQSLQINSEADLAYYVPGLQTVGSGVPGSRSVFIRGLSAGDEGVNSSLVAYYLDDLPVGGSSREALASSTGLDLNPYDIDRIEVLKGPQGTLYGATAMAGLIKYSLKKPSLNDFEATAGGNLEDIDNSTGPGWAVRGAISMPLVTDRLALRISAFDKRNSGYIDNLFTGEKGFNSATEAGGLATLLWVPTEHLTVNAKVVIQDVNEAATATVAVNSSTGTPAFGGLYYNDPLLHLSQNSTRIYSLTVDWNADFATLTSTTGWSKFAPSYTNPLALIGFFCVPGALGPGYPGCPNYPHADAIPTAGPSYNTTDKFVQEVRLTSPQNQRLQWLVGGFFTHELAEFTFHGNVYTPAGVLVLPEDQFAYYVNHTTYKEAAGFADLTFNVTNYFDLTAGGRHSAYSIKDCGLVESGLLFYGGSPSCVDAPSVGVTTWMTNARFHLNSDSMLYLRAADGYRPGYNVPIALPGTPSVIKPDDLIDYELGFKGSFLNGRLQLDAAVYHILWHDMQTTSISPVLGPYASNAGKATSDGFEFTGAYQLTAGLSVVGTVARSHAYLTEDQPGKGAKDGDLLPYEAPWTGSLRVNYTTPIYSGYSLLLGAAYRYKDAYLDNFSSVQPTHHFATENLLDLSAGLTAKATTLRIYATNVFNRLLFTNWVGGDIGPNTLFIPVQPRTVGLSVDYKY